MALITLKFMSEVLGRQSEIIVVVPQRNTSGEIGQNTKADSVKYKTLLMLHGLSDDNTIWLRRSNIERYASEHGIAVVMPSGDRSFYTDMKHGDKFYTYVSQEVLAVAREFLPLSDKREDNFIAGNSMGGYGAIKIALKNPDKFVSAVGLSSVSDIVSFMEDITPNLKDNIFGDGDIDDEENLFRLAEKYANRQNNPRILMCVGKDDFLYQSNVKLKKQFEKLEYDYKYYEDEGMHTWEFWDKQLPIILKWILDK